MVIGCGAGGAGGIGKPSEAALASTKIEFTAYYNIEQATLTVFQLDGGQRTFQECGMLLKAKRRCKVGFQDTVLLQLQLFQEQLVVKNINR